MKNFFSRGKRFFKKITRFIHIVPQGQITEIEAVFILVQDERICFGNSLTFYLFKLSDFTLNTASNKSVCYRYSLTLRWDTEEERFLGEICRFSRFDMNVFFFHYCTVLFVVSCSLQNLFFPQNLMSLSKYCQQ